MASIPSGIIIFWPGTNSSIPSGWTRTTSLDSTFSKGTAVSTNPNVTGGGTHTHLSSAHTHTLTSHTHAGTTNTSNTTANYSVYGLTKTDPHLHTYTTGSVGGTSGGDSPTWDTKNGDPSFFDVIHIQSNGTPTGFPQDCMVLRTSATLPSGWTQNTGSKARFLRGATGGGDGGGTGGGGHTHAGSSHTHTFPNHTHGTTTSSSYSGTSTHGAGYYTTEWSATHNHTTTPAADGSGTSGAGTTSTAQSTSYEPTFHTLFGLQNDSAGDDWLEDSIVAFLGTLANIPDDWVLCDGGSSTPDLRNKFIKVANVSGDIGTTGGSAGHTHTPNGHTHGSTGHTHSVSVTPSTAGSSGSTGGSGTPSKDHTHADRASDSDDPGLASDSQNVTSTADTQPAFRTVAYLRAPEEPVSGSPIFFGANF